MDSHFFQSLNENTIVVTANRRLASYLQHQYAQHQQSQQQQVWITPTILPLSTWLTLLWHKIDGQYQILSDIQERALWQQLSQQHWTAVQSIQQAWNTLQAWDMDSEAQTIFQWADEFKHRCRERQWISTAEIPQQLLHSSKLTEHLPASLFVVGFDDLPPIITTLFNKIKLTCTVNIIKPDSLSAKVNRFELPDQAAELAAMAMWAVTEYQNNPNKKIACVVPNLTQIRQQAVRAFDEALLLSRNSITKTAPYSDITINISAGQNLTEFLMIQTALNALQEKWQDILQSPYLAQTDDDLDMAAFVDKMRRSQNLSHFETHDLLPFFTALKARFPRSTYLKRWNQLLAFKKTLCEQQSLHQWLQTFTELLKILGWPGTRTLDTVEHQVLQRWLAALEELITCNAIFNEISYDTALMILQQHMSHIVFQPKTDEAAIQVLGILETAGMSFDSIWVMGLDNRNWPPPASPNPFLPYDLQIKHKMPHASAERELQFTQQTMKRLLSSAKTVYLSSAKMEADSELAPSQLIQCYSLSAATAYENSNTVVDNNHCFETIADTHGKPLIKNQAVKGGTAIIKFQAICPFRAYATFRLAAEPLEKPALGLSPRLRGELLHQVLESFWQRLQSQNKLLAMNDQQLNEIIMTIIDEIMPTQNINKTDSQFIDVEKKRLEKIISDWLTLEKQRSPFTVIAEESSRPINIGNLSFQCRIDRIDQLADGSRIIIDYKTGYSNVNDWFSDRPPDPQLPVYCVFGHDTVYEGLAFAQVRAGAMQFKGITNKELDDDKLIPIAEFDNVDTINDWNKLTSHWQTTLENLSDHFCQGQAVVDPLPMACDHCHLKSLCRVNRCLN